MIPRTDPRRRISHAFKVPTWIAGLEPRPPIWRHPLRRVQAWRWKHLRNIR